MSQTIDAIEDEVVLLDESGPDPLSAGALLLERLPQRGVVRAELARTHASIGEDGTQLVVDRGVEDVSHGTAPAREPAARAMG